MSALVTLLSAMLTRLGAGIAAAADATVWMPRQASTHAGEVDFVFYFVFWIAAFFFALITVLMVWFVWRYRRRRPEQEAESHVSHNTPLETIWSVIPLLLVIAIFWFGFRGFLSLAVPPRDSYEIGVIGQKWAWQFAYPGGYEDNELHVPVNTPVRLVMTSPDVLHSLFIPAFRVKKDVVPGRYTELWFEATEVGEFTIFCTEYCGTSHSDMLSKVIVHEPGEFEEWLDEASNIVGRYPPEEAGAILYEKRGCQTCHTTTGAVLIGPSFKGLYGGERVMTDGGRMVADENYIRRSILEPQAEVVAGFQGVMPTYQGRIKDEEIGAIIAFIKSLSGAEETP